MLYIIVAVVVLILDQGLKYWVSANITLDAGIVYMIPGVFHLCRIHNEGVAFGLLNNFDMRWILVGLAVVFGALIVVFLLRGKIQGRFGRIAAVLVLGGALGNAIDRAIQGYVVDMIELDFITFPVFNIADMCLIVGAVLFCFYIIFHKDPEVAQAGGKPSGSRRRAASQPTTTPIESVGDIEQVSRPNLDEMTGRLPSIYEETKAPPRQHPRHTKAQHGAPSHTQSPKHSAPRSPTPNNSSYTAPANNAAPRTPTSAEAAPRPTPPKAKSSGSEFSLEDILDEFRD